MHKHKMWIANRWRFILRTLYKVEKTSHNAECGRKNRLRKCTLYCFYFKKKWKSHLIDLEVFLILQHLYKRVWLWTNQHPWSQQSKFWWIFLTIFVNWFLPGLNDETISSICWILEIEENIQYHCFVTISFFSI